MQGLLSTSLPALSSSNLAHHTSLHPPAPRRSVHAYLATTTAVQGQYEDPPLSPDRVVAPFEGVNTPPRFRAWRDAHARQGEAAAEGHDTDRKGKRTRDAADAALVLHRPGEPDGDEARRKKSRRPLLVQAMRGRASVPAAPREHGHGAAGEGTAGEAVRGADGGSAASSVLVPRVERAAGGDEVRKMGKGKEKETKQKAPKGGKLRAEAEAEDELDEVEERASLALLFCPDCSPYSPPELTVPRFSTGLRARRERRRAKTLIRTDRTLPAAAIGDAAAAKLKAKRRKDALAHDDDDDYASEQENESARAREKRAKRATKAGESRRLVHEMGRAKNVAPGRLTVRCNLTLS